MLSPVNKNEIIPSKRIQDPVSESPLHNFFDHEEFQKLLHVAGHDFMEPLRIITGYCDLILDPNCSDVSEHKKNWIKNIRDNATRCQNMVEYFSDFLSLEINNLEFQEVHLESLVNSTLKQIRHKFRGINIEVINRTDAGLKINVDSHKIFRALEEILTNAALYSPDDSKKIRLVISKLKDDVIFKITNWGNPISNKFHKEIFRPFSRLQSYSKAKGQGLGIPIAEKILFMHGGKLELEPTLKNENTFVITIPTRS